MGIHGQPPLEPQIPPSDPGGRGASKGAFFFTVFLACSVLALSVFVLLLIRSNRDLNSKLVAAQQALAREQTKDSLAVGESVGPLTLIDAAGTSRTVGFSGERSTLVFMVSAHCPYCDDTVPLWDRALRQTDARSNSALSVLCIQIDARAPEDLKKLPDTLTPTLVKSEAGTWLHRIPLAPGAVLIDRAGVVRRVWFGVPGERDLREIEAALLGGL